MAGLALASLPDGDDEHERMHMQGWSDGLPLVAPTSERVECMLRGTARPASEVLGVVPPSYTEATVGLVAVNAVMAGCEPAHLRIVLAAVEAVLSEPFNLHGVGATTMGATPCVIVSGPARHEAGLALSCGAMGSGTRANATYAAQHPRTQPCSFDPLACVRLAAALDGR